MKNLFIISLSVLVFHSSSAFAMNPLNLEADKAPPPACKRIIDAWNHCAKVEIPLEELKIFTRSYPFMRQYVRFQNEHQTNTENVYVMMHTTSARDQLLLKELVLRGQDATVQLEPDNKQKIRCDWFITKGQIYLDKVKCQKQDGSSVKMPDTVHCFERRKTQWTLSDNQGRSVPVVISSLKRTCLFNTAASYYGNVRKFVELIDLNDENYKNLGLNIVSEGESDFINGFFNTKVKTTPGMLELKRQDVRKAIEELKAIKALSKK